MLQQRGLNGGSSRSKRILNLALKRQNEDPYPPPKRTKQLPKNKIHDTGRYLSMYDSGRWDALDDILNSHKRQIIGPATPKDQPKGSILRPLHDYQHCITNTTTDSMQDTPPWFTENTSSNSPPLHLKDPQSDLREIRPPCFAENTSSNSPPLHLKDLQSNLRESTPPCFAENTSTNSPPLHLKDLQSDLRESTPQCFTENTSSNSPTLNLKDPQSDLREIRPPCFAENTSTNSPPLHLKDLQSDLRESTPPCFTENTSTNSPPLHLKDLQSDLRESTPQCFTENTSSNSPTLNLKDPQSDLREIRPPCFAEKTSTNSPPLHLKDLQSDLRESTPPCFTENTSTNSPPLHLKDLQSDLRESTPQCFTENTSSNSPTLNLKDPQSDLREIRPPCFAEKTSTNSPPLHLKDLQSDLRESTPPFFTENTSSNSPTLNLKDPQSDLRKSTSPCSAENTSSNSPPLNLKDPQSDLRESTPPCLAENISSNSPTLYLKDPQSDLRESTPPCFAENTSSNSPTLHFKDPQSDLREIRPPCFAENTSSNSPPLQLKDLQSDLRESTPPCFAENTSTNSPPLHLKDLKSDLRERTPPCFAENTSTNSPPLHLKDIQSDLREIRPPCFAENTSSDSLPLNLKNPQSDLRECTLPGFLEDALTEFGKESRSDTLGEPYSSLTQDLPLNSFLLIVPPDSNNQNVNACSTTSPIEIICDPDFIFITPESISGATENTITPSSNSKLDNDFKCTSQTENSSKCTRRSLFSTNTQTDTTSKKRIRREDRRNYCVFCEKVVLNFRRHVINNHKNEPIIAEYIALFETCPNESKGKRSKILESLRLKGNHLHNQSLLHQSTVVNIDKMLPVKRPPIGKIVTSSDFVTCTLCHGLFLRKHFFQHANLCKRTSEEKELLAQHEDPIDNSLECEDLLTPQDQLTINRRQSTFLKEYGLAYCPKSKDITPLMEENIFKTLNKDTIGIKAMNDSLLVDVVSDYYTSHHAYKDRNQVTRKLRDGAKLVLEVNSKDNEVKELKDLFNPNKIDVVIKACQKMCNLQDQNGNDDNCLKNVIVGMNGRLSWVLEEGGKRLIDNIVCDISLTDEQKEIKKRKVINFQECLRRRWKYCISTNIEIARRRLKIFKDTVMPLDEDIVKFASMLRRMEVEYQFKLQKEVTVESYEMLCKVTICHILTLNRRRPFEATHSDISFYLKKVNDSDYYSPDVLKSFANEEKVSMNELKSYVVPAKGNEEIATILLTKSMEKSIDLIISCRKYLLLENSKYLFARPGLKTPFDGSAVMREMKLLCPDLKKPQHLTATGLRHHVATVGHIKGPIFSSKLSKFMCHTQSVHDKNYVAPLSIVHRGVIGNYLAGLEGTSLNDRQHRTAMKDVTNVKSTQQHTSLEHHNTPDINTTADEEEINDPSFNPEEENSSEDENCNMSEAGEKGVTVFKKKNKTRGCVDNVTKDKKKRWSEEDKQLVVQYFGNFIKQGKNPGTIKCRQFLEECNMLPGRTPAQVNTFIDNVNKKKLKLSQSILNVLKT